ncbi:TPA: hypothetical protein JI037_00715 [Acinetobacter baumannii]|nr:hypothetical protein [Acinetobacter baumannii]HAV5322550.1 hypothetical protein [Acinetobacter baumannii]HAV5329366.1 hypothetical protein [Acinetobacter baumannii]HAV5361027.1 hypothetical protein [Acinetobacter baumannii]HAV5533602.1 hypothetical protein [Acinetobacter baumannii]
MTDLNKERMELELSAGVLDRQIDNLKAEIADEYFDDEKLELLIEYAMKLGEVYAQRDLLEKAKAQAVPEGFKIVPIELSEEIAERLALERVQKPRPENDPVWVEIAERAYKSNLLAKKWELVREYKILTEASESGAEG